MVGDDGDIVCSSLEILTPFFQCQIYCKKFTVIDIIVSCSKGEGMRKVSTGM